MVTKTKLKMATLKSNIIGLAPDVGEVCLYADLCTKTADVHNISVAHNPAINNTGDILAVYHGQWALATIIRNVTQHESNHLGLFVKSDGSQRFLDAGIKEGEWAISEMEREGHVLTPWNSDKYKEGKATDRTLIKYSLNYGIPETEEELIRFILSNDSRYDIGALFNHLLRRVSSSALNRIGITHRGFWLGRKNARAARRMTCSEWVAYFYNTYTGLYPYWWSNHPGDVVTKYEPLFIASLPKPNSIVK